MRRAGSAEELERRRSLAMRRLRDGHSARDVARFLEVDVRTVFRWKRRCREAGGADETAAAGRVGRPAKLSPTQTKIVLRWLRDRPAEHGFSTDLWTAARLAALIRREWDVSFHPRYLCAWLRARGCTPQRPQRAPRERDPEAIAAWLRRDWPRIKKTRAVGTRRSCSSTKAGC